MTRRLGPRYFCCLFVLLGAVVLIAMQPTVFAQGQGEPQQLQVRTGEILPVAASSLRSAAPALSAQEYESLLLRKLAIRDQMAAEADKNLRPGTAGVPADLGNPLEIRAQGFATMFPGNPVAMETGHANLNPRSSMLGGSVLAEPAAANNADFIFAAGNYAHTEASFDGGATWTDNQSVGPGPPTAPIPCCDNDVVIDDARRVVFHSIVYLNSAVNTGVVRIHVFQDPVAWWPGPVTADCAYDIDAGLGVLLDYPHLGLTKRYLYLTTNEVGAGIASGQRARMYRFDANSMVNCGPLSFSFVDWYASTDGQRVWVPAEGTNNGETMYWGHNATPTMFRLFWWDETGGAFYVTRALAATNFAGPAPDCRGGTNNTDFISATNASIIGFNLRGTVMAIRDGAGTPYPPGPGYHQGIAFYWQSRANPPSRPQAFIRAAVFRDGTGSHALFSEPDLYLTAYCAGFPHVTSNKRGDIGFSFSFGGKAGGGGLPAQMAFGIADENTEFGNPVVVGHPDVIWYWPAGTHNPADGRFGDYFTIHSYEPCEKWFSTINYFLDGGTSLTNTKSWYFEFGRNQTSRCYNSHYGQLPNPNFPTLY